MLVHLRAQNLGLIRDANLEPGPGLTVITGETGAGKTLLLGALRLLMGESPDGTMVGVSADSSQADGLFSGDRELGVSRVVPRDGRSRSYVDGKVVSAKTLTRTIADLVQIIGQHDRLELLKPRYVRELIDSNLDENGRELQSRYRAAWLDLHHALEEQQILGGSRLELAGELDLVKYQNREISQAGFVDGDDELLEAQNLRLRNASQIREHLGTALSALETLESAAGELVSGLRKVKDLDPATASMTEAAESLSYAVTELGRELSSSAGSLVDDPETLATIESRLNLLGDLKMRYGRTLADILDFAVKNTEREHELSHLLDRSQSIETEVELARVQLSKAADDLTTARRNAASRIALETESHLRDLALESASVVFEFEPEEPGARGANRIRIVFSSHESLEPAELSKVASGGELSRLVLAIKLAAGKADAATLVFDEVDSGVGGATALAMAHKLANLARSQQVLCVTHLPQVAAFADVHFVVTRSGADASVARCEGAERLAELSRMIAGLPESQRGQQAAAELLELASI